VRIPFLFVATLLVACGPSAAEQKAAAEHAEARKDCGRTYSSSEKVLQDLFYSRGVAEVEFIDRSKYIEKCVELKLSSAELKCVDPNLAEGEECKALAEDSRKKVTELQKFMTSPMRKDADTKKAEGDKSEGEAGGEAAGGAEGEAKTEGETDGEGKTEGEGGGE